MRWLTRLGVFAVCVAFCASCASIEAHRKAETVLDRYFQALLQQDYDTALAMCAEEFFKNVTRQEWQERLERTGREQGLMASYRAAKWTIEHLPNGTFVTFDVTVQHGQREILHVVTVVAPQATDDLLVFGHHIHAQSGG